MKLATIGAAASLMGLQIQRSFHKLGFVITGAKAAGVESAAQLLADAKNVFVSLKRVSQDIGEKIIWPRMSLYELINCALTLEGNVIVTGLAADTAYTGRFYMELNLEGAILIQGGDYLELNFENAVAGFGADVIGVGHKIATKNHLRLERTTLQPNEFKTIPCEMEGLAAVRVLVPDTIADGRVNGGNNPFTIDATDVKALVAEKNHFILSTDAKSALASYAPIDSYVDQSNENHVRTIDVTNGAAASSVLVIRQVYYR